MKTIAWMLALTLVSTACSRNKSAQSVSDETPQIELSDADEFSEVTEPLADTDLGDTQPLEATEGPVMDSMAAEPSVAEVAPNAPEISMEAAPTAVTLGEGEGEYTVQKSETLMLIAFKLYGDYNLWRNLANKNPDVMKNGIIPAGAKIKYNLPSQAFDWSPQGNPYLIRTGDTLGGISGSVYGTVKKWKSIWDNNKPLIKDPNRIYAGFTLYWLEQEKVAGASGTNLEL